MNQLPPEIIEKAWEAVRGSISNTRGDIMSEEMGKRVIACAIEAVYDDIQRPVINLLRGWKRDAQAYNKALEEIREYACDNAVCEDIADRALKGYYHEPREESNHVNDT